MERYRFHSDGAVFFVTFAVVEWLPVFVGERACKIVTASLDFCHHNKGLRTNAYVIMPTHLHENPCRKGLVRRAEDWRFSSAAYWLSEGKPDAEVILSAIEW